MISRGFRRLAGSGLGIIAGVFAATGSLPGVAGSALAADTILIGEYGSMTGAEATFGQSTHEGIMLAVKERNAAGGVKGKQVEIKLYDDQGKAQEVTTAVTRLITQDKVVAILGEVASSRSIAGGQVAQRYKTPMITPSSTNPQVTEIGDMIFRVCFIDSFQGFVCAKFAKENLKATKAATLYDRTQAYSTGLNEDFKRAFTQLGGTIVTEQAYSGGDSDFGAQLTTIRETNPDVIFIPGYYNDVGNIAIQVRKLGIKAPMLGGDGWDSAQLAATAGEAIEGSYYSNHYSHEENRPAVQEFVKRYQEEYGRVPDGLAALGYDAALMLFDALDKAESTKGKDIAKVLAGMKDFQGVTGVISMDEKRNARKPAVIVEMKGGIPRYVATIDPQ